MGICFLSRLEKMHDEAQLDRRMEQVAELCETLRRAAVAWGAEGGMHLLTACTHDQGHSERRLSLEQFKQAAHTIDQVIKFGVAALASQGTLSVSAGVKCDIIRAVTARQTRRVYWNVAPTPMRYFDAPFPPGLEKRCEGTGTDCLCVSFRRSYLDEADFRTGDIAPDADKMRGMTTVDPRRSVAD